MAILIDGPGQGAGLPLIAGRTAPVSRLSKDTRTYLQRIVDEVSSSVCPGCKAPVRVIKIDQLGMCVTDACGAVIGFSASLPATRTETPAEKRASASRLAAFARLTKDIVTRMKRGRA